MSDALINSMFGSYKLTAVLGRGGMATVYRGYQEAVDRYVAVKVLPAELMHDNSFAARFTNEARMLARLTHPSILPLYDFGNANGMPYIVMPLMTGGSLADKVTRGPLPIAEIGRIFTPIAQALDFAHKQGVLHRDVKPNNILFDQHDNPFLSDFGIAKAMEGASTLTGTGVIGTPDYMSPEQARGETIDGRSDVYSLGVVAYQSLTGHQLFQATTPMGVIFKHATEAPRPLHEVRPDIPLPVEKVILRALAKSPAERYQTATEFAQALLAVISTVNSGGLSAASPLSTYVSEGPLTPMTPPPPPPPAPPSGAYGNAPQSPSGRTGPQTPADPLVTLLPSEGAINYPGTPAAPPPVAPAKKGNRGLIVGGVLAAALCLIAICGLGGYYVATQTDWLAQLGIGGIVAQATPTPDASTKLIAFVSNRDGNNEIYVMNADGSNQQALLHAQNENRLPIWSSDGTRLTYTSDKSGNYEIYLIQSDGSNEINLTNDPGNDGRGSWSPDDGRIAFHSNREGNFDVFVMNADGSNQINLTADSQSDDMFVAWAPSGSTLAFTSKRDGNSEIYVMNVDGSQLVNLTNDPSVDERPNWSPDSQYIAFASDRSGNFEIYVMRSDGTDVVQLTNDAGVDGFPSWSPDGKKILFTTNRDGNQEIYEMNSDGTGQKQLTNDPADDFAPSWQPFGK